MVAIPSGIKQPSKKTAAPTVSSYVPQVSVQSSNPYLGMTGAQQAAAMGYVTPDIPAYEAPKLTDMTPFIKGLAQIANTKIAPINYGTINTNAARLTNAAINPQVQSLLNQQRQYIDTGNQQAGLVNRAGIAAANLTRPWANDIFSNYQGLADQAYQVAQGYSGATRDAALADAAAVRDQLAGFGSTQAPDTGRTEALHQTLLGLGNMAGNTLGLQGLAAKQGAIGIPQGMLGYSQAQAAGMRGAAQQAAQALTPKISEIQATRPKVMQDYIQTLTTQAMTQRDFQQKMLAMRADILGSGAQIAGNVNTQRLTAAGQKLDYQRFAFDAQNAHNDQITAINQFNQQMAQIDETKRSNMVNELQQGMTLAEATRHNQAVEADAAEQTLLAWGTLQEKTKAANAKLDTSYMNAITNRDRARGYYVMGTGKNARVYPLPGRALVRNSDGSFAGYTIRDKSQYNTNKGKGAKGGLTALQVTKARSKAADLAKIYALGQLPKPVTFHNKTTYPGVTIDPQTGGWSIAKGQEAIFEGAGGVPPLSYWAAVRRIANETGGALTVEEIRSALDTYAQAFGPDAAYQTAVPQMPASPSGKSGVVTGYGIGR